MLLIILMVLIEVPNCIAENNIADVSYAAKIDNDVTLVGIVAEIIL